MLIATAVITNSSYNANGVVYGQVVVTVSGGVQPYTYQWSDGQSSNTAISLSPASYTLLVTDSAGETNTFAYTVQDTLGVYFSKYDCTHYLARNGEVTVSVYGGTPPYTIAWSNGSTSTNVRRLSEGNYSCSVEDTTGLSASSSVYISQPLQEKSFSVDNMDVSTSIDISTDCTLYFGGRAMRMRFDADAGSIVFEKLIAGIWTKKIEI
jgi:SprB repeat